MEEQEVQIEEKVVVKRPPKSPGLAGVLAFFFPFGTGALYNAQFKKAAMFFFVFAGLVSLQPSAPQPFVALMLAGFFIYQIFDAVQTAKAINRASLHQKLEPVTDIEEIPVAITSGSIFWGISLMILGGILLLANFEVIDYDTLWEFWPIAVIFFGLKLVVDYYKQKS
jgi:hypothetical protein